MDSLVQPIALIDALEALVGALEYTGPSRHFDLGGPDRLRYGALLDAYTSYAGLERPQVEVPLLPTALVGTLVGSLTDVPRPMVEALVESLRHDMVAANDDFREMPPGGHRGRRPDGAPAAGPGLGQRRRRPARSGQDGRRGQGRPAGLLSAPDEAGSSN